MLSSLRRLSTVAVAAGLALSGTVAHAAPLPALGAVVAPQAVTTQVSAAATWLASQQAADGSFQNSLAMTADAAIALASAGKTAELTKAATYLTANTTASTPVGQQAKVALALLAAGKDPRTAIPGVDLLANIAKADVSTANAYTLPLFMLALTQAGEPVPAAMKTAATKQITSGATGFGMDVDGMLLAAFSALAPTDSEAKTTAIALRDALASAYKNNTAGTFWPSDFSPVNATGVAGPAMETVGFDVSKARTWMEGKQLAGGAFASTIDGTDPDLYATIQAIPFLAGYSYLQVGPSPVTAVDLGTATATPTPTATPTWSPKVGQPMSKNACTASNGIWVQVEFESTPWHSACVTEDVATGEAALTAAGFQVKKDKYGMVCAMMFDGEMKGNCSGTFTGSYWSYFHATPTATGMTGWTESSIGAGQYDPALGTAEGWNFSANALPQPLVAGEAAPSETTPAGEQNPGLASTGEAR